MDTLPQVAIDMLPLSAEPMSQWKKDTDIRVFAQAVYTDSPSYASKLCARLEEDMRKQARVFTNMLKEVPQSSTHLDFYQDARFGHVAKYAIALKCCIDRLLADAGFYSLAHVLEAESDLDCSLLLASNFYYKQASLMLRGILEEVLLPIHFCENVSDFDNWKANNYRTPSLRGRDGLIQRLLKKNIIHEPLATQTANLYGNLSAYIHGSQNTLVHHNIHLGEVHRVEFNQSIYAAWCQLFCECIGVCVRLQKINYDQWAAIRALKFETLAKVGKTLCHTCHNEDAFDRWLLPSEYIFTPRVENGEETKILENTGGLAFYRYICQRCGHAITVNANETPLTKVFCIPIGELPPRSHATQYVVLMRSTADPYCEWYILEFKGAGEIANVVTPLLVHLNT